MAKASKPKKESKASEQFQLIRAFTEKALGHGLVATEEEKDAIENALDAVEIDVYAAAE